MDPYTFNYDGHTFTKGRSVGMSTTGLRMAMAIHDPRAQATINVSAELADARRRMWSPELAEGETRETRIWDPEFAYTEPRTDWITSRRVATRRPR